MNDCAGGRHHPNNERTYEEADPINCLWHLCALGSSAWFTGSDLQLFQQQFHANAVHEFELRLDQRRDDRTNLLALDAEHFDFVELAIPVAESKHIGQPG